MKQCTDARAVKFLRPKFVQMIEWKFDVHLALLLQLRKSRDLVVAAAVSAAVSLQAFVVANASKPASIGAHRKPLKWQPLLSLRKPSRTARRIACKTSTRVQSEP